MTARIDHVAVTYRYMPDFVELWVNHGCVYRARPDRETLMTAWKLKAYYERKAYEQA